MKLTGILLEFQMNLTRISLEFTRSLLDIAAQCEIPPHIAQYPFEIVSQRGVSHPFALFFIGYRASIAEIPLLSGGGIAPPLRMLSKGERSEKGEGVSHPIVETPKTP